METKKWKRTDCEISSNKYKLKLQNAYIPFVSNKDWLDTELVYIHTEENYFAYKWYHFFLSDLSV